MEFLNSSDEILSVGEFSRRLKMLVKTRVPELWLRGEVSNVREYSSGHIYFTLKDSDASISAVLFKGYAAAASFKLRDGLKVLLYGEISVYEVRGTYQMVVKAMMPDGTGDLARRFEELKKKLASEGLFDEANKIEIPRICRKIAVVTSPSGAAIQDFLRILQRRGWLGRVYILPSKVQGAEAAKEIAAQIKFADNFLFADGSKFDVIVAMRGGGSLEDLFAFSEEVVARAVAGAQLPIISAVGHEIDFSLSDFAADVRAETPSAAAEIISSSFIDCVARIEDAQTSLEEIVLERIGRMRQRICSLSDVLRLNSPQDKINNFNLRIDEIWGRFLALVSEKISGLKLRVGASQAALSAVNPKNKTDVYRQRLEGLEKHLELLGIENTLKRGFALVLDADGKIAPSSKALKDGENISLKFFDGEKRARVL